MMQRSQDGRFGRIAVFGGTGFIGRHVTPLLVNAGATVRVIGRHLDHMATPAQAQVSECMQADVRDDDAVARALAGADAVINLVGILTETASQTYEGLHVDAARRIATAAARQETRRLIHVSALGATRNSPALSDRTKAEGELAVRAASPAATIVRPSLVYGEDDHFFTMLAAISSRSPVLPLIGGGNTLFQPVAVADIAAGLVQLLKRPDTAGETYEFGGPAVYSFSELVRLLLAALGRPRLLISIPFAVAEVMAGLLERLPNPPLTRDQVRLLRTDKVVGGTRPKLADLGVLPVALEPFLAVLSHHDG